MSCLEQSESRRLEEVAVAAKEWIAQRNLDELVSESTLRSPHGTVAILECSADYRSAIQESGDVAAALAPLRKRATEDDDLLVIRRLPMAGSQQTAESMCLEGFGAVAAERSANDDEDDEGFGNGARYPGEHVKTVLLAVPRAAARGSTTVSLVRADKFVSELTAETVSVLERDLAFELREDGRAEQAAPIITRDSNFHATLQYSKQLKENVEWAPETTESVCDALDELHAIATDGNHTDDTLKFSLRHDDLFLLDAKRWLYRLRFENTNVDNNPASSSREQHDDVRFARGMWIPVAALSAHEREDTALPRDPLVVHALLLP